MFIARVELQTWIVVCMIKSASQGNGLADLRWSISQTPCVPISHKVDVLFLLLQTKVFFISMLSANQCKKERWGVDGGEKEKHSMLRE